MVSNNSRLLVRGFTWALLLIWAGAGDAWAQRFDQPARSEFSLTVELPETRNETKNLLAQVDQQLQQENWQEAIDTLGRLISDHGSELIAAGQDQVDLESRYTYYVDLKSYLQRRISHFSRQTPDFLEAYRQRVDPLAAEILSRAQEERDIKKLTEGIDDYFLSSYADQALLMLGDLLVEQGRFNDARTAWERISPRFRTPEDPQGVFLAMPGQPIWIAVDGVDWDTHGNYIRQQLENASGASLLATIPQSDVDPAAVWARLCLVSWLEGSQDRARVELELLARLHPGAIGHFGGRQVNYAEYLKQLVASSPGRVQSVDPNAWPTFAGDVARNRKAEPVEPATTYEPRWSVGLEPQGLSRSPRHTGEPTSQWDILLIGDSPEDLLSTHPVVFGDNLLLSDERRVRAFELKSGHPAFPTLEGRFLDEDEPEFGTFHPSGTGQDSGFGGRAQRGLSLSQITLKLTTAVGAPRFTMSGEGSKVVARVGSTVVGLTGHPGQFQEPANMMVFDLEEEGKLKAQVPPVTELSGPWAFEGTAIISGNRLYCGMTKAGVRDESAIACFDWTTAQLLWRRTVAVTQPYGSGLVTDGDYGHRANNLLTMKDGVLYYNTNRGVIAAVDAERGKMLWLTRYPRRLLTPTSLEKSHLTVQRDLSPCIVTRGMVLAMPLDCERLFALDAATGQLIWQTVPGGVEPVHLLGTSSEDVLVSGEQLFWIHLHSGKVRAEFPAAEQANGQTAFGRGVLAGDQVFWPTKDKVYRLKLELKEGRIVQPAAPPIDLAEFGEQGGNVLVAQGHLIVASPRRLTVYAPRDISPRDPANRADPMQ